MWPDFKRKHVNEEFVLWFPKRVWRPLIFAHQIPSNLPDSTEGGKVYQLLMRLIGPDPGPIIKINWKIMKWKKKSEVTH